MLKVFIRLGYQCTLYEVKQSLPEIELSDGGLEGTFGEINDSQGEAGCQRVGFSIVGFILGFDADLS